MTTKAESQTKVGNGYHVGRKITLLKFLEKQFVLRNEDDHNEYVKLTDWCTIQLTEIQS